MRSRMLLIMAKKLLLLLMLSGCGIGGFWMNGDPSVGKNITPLRDYWHIFEGKKEERARHWVECGGMENGGYGIYKEGVTSKNISAVSREIFYNLQICMIKKGYRYVGSCDGEIRSDYPACRGIDKEKIIYGKSAKN